MNNIHPMFHEILAAMCPPSLPFPRKWEITIKTNGGLIFVPIRAYTSVDAITAALEKSFPAEQTIPSGGMSITSRMVD